MPDNELNNQLVGMLKQLTDTLQSLALYGLVNPDRELTLKELDAVTGVSVSTWKRRQAHNHIWANAFFPVGDKAGEHKTTIRKIRQAQDELSYSEQQFRARMAA